MKDDRRFYVYVILRPSDGSPCYIGKGSGRRWATHDTRCHNPRLRKILDTCKGNVIRVRIREHLSETEALEIECALIKAIGRGHKGPLVNMTDGGEGTSGYKRTPEEIEAIRERSKNRVWTDEQRQAARERMKNFKHTEETKAKIGAANKGKKLSEEQIEKMRLAHIGKKLSPEHSEKVSANFKKPKSESHKAKLRALCIERNKKGLSDASKAKISAANKGRPSAFKGHVHTEETKKKLSDSKKGKPSLMKGRKQSKEFCVKMSAAAKVAQANRKRDSKGRYGPKR